MLNYQILSEGIMNRVISMNVIQTRGGSSASFCIEYNSSDGVSGNVYARTKQETQDYFNAFMCESLFVVNGELWQI